GEFAPSVAGQLRNIGDVSKALQVVHKEQLDARAELDKEFADLASEISVAQDIPTEQDEDDEPKDGEEENDDANDEGEEEEEKTGEVETVSADASPAPAKVQSEEHTSELQSRFDLVCRLLLEKKKNKEQTA